MNDDLEPVIRAKVHCAPGEANPDAPLAFMLQVYADKVLAMRLYMARDAAEFVLERVWLPNHRAAYIRLFDRIERRLDEGDAVLTRNGERPLSLLCVFEDIEKRVLDL